MQHTHTWGLRTEISAIKLEANQLEMTEDKKW